MAVHELRIAPLPIWLDAGRLLGPAGPASDPGDASRGWHLEPQPDASVVARAQLDGARAADLAARLRGLGFEGQPLVCEIQPPLRRSQVRRARTEDARRRRVGTPGFSRAGTRLDEVGRMSLTPELLAMEVAELAAGRPVVDAGCGAGGNAIAFARAGCRVHAIDQDLARLELARHNAGVYGVSDRIQFVHADARAWVAAQADPGAILFVDPPWGADWSRSGCDLASLPLLADLVPLASNYAALWAKVPPSFATAQLLEGASGDARALFGAAEGDYRRVKFVLVRRG
ncbi:methyltransferase domain-containing protein [Enhygromyxa salina]|uniref:Mg-protoporphyrin IX methyl transferase n=1 Tax=Enhygromyxa salina TaxID=215803 RepID=A0A2S9XX95_9BACT|nr:methyltransferase domain-containing protein [Enhygromyxa salina]PRP97341.1 Mg-protoporphyrin IX methyl transferase [Enhygromyxa salina]